MADETPENTSDSTDRLSMVLVVNHQRGAEQPREISVRQGLMLRSSEDAVVRSKQLPDGGNADLDTYWIESPGMFVVHNATKYEGNKLPSQAEKDAIARAVLAVYVGGVIVSLLPVGAFTVLYAPGNVSVEAQGGAVTVQWSVCPE